jgi:hypothetical protein
MSSGISFGAPWGKSLKAVTAFTVAMLLGIAIIGFLTGPRGGTDGVIWFAGMAVSPLLIVILALPFAVRGYVLSRKTLLVKRMGWCSRIELEKLVEVEIDPKAMARSIRTFGNGGLFGFTGLYWNRKLGSYRAYVTDFRFCVVLRFARGVVIVSPDDPKAFVRDLKMLRGM